MNQRGVRSVTVTYTDGETETFSELNGFYRMTRNNDPKNQKLVDVWNEHEIRWSDR